MARQLQLMHPQSRTFQVGMAGASFLLCAFALFMCASHARKLRRRWNACLDYGYENDDLVIELNREATVVTTLEANATEPENDDNNEMFFSREQQAAVWQKNIIMGGKCQLPDFSGVIMYDSDGNVVMPAKTPRPLLTIVCSLESFKFQHFEKGFRSLVTSKPIDDYITINMTIALHIQHGRSFVIILQELE